VFDGLTEVEAEHVDALVHHLVHGFEVVPCVLLAIHALLLQVGDQHPPLKHMLILAPHTVKFFSPNSAPDSLMPNHFSLVELVARPITDGAAKAVLTSAAAPSKFVKSILTFEESRCDV
jgi:hypothetical protein